MQRADQRKHHYIYKITRDDGRYYIGMHSTDDLEDGYFGSGKLITRSIKKHGKERHSKEILEVLSTRALLKDREKELITDELRLDPMCMNIAPGGGGGFKDEAHQRKCAAAGNASPKRDHSKNVTKSNLTRIARGQKPFGGRGAGLAFLNQFHSEQTKAKMSASQQGKQVGEKNSQFGTCWVTDGVRPIKIKKEQLSEYLQMGYSKGRIYDQPRTQTKIPHEHR